MTRVLLKVLAAGAPVALACSAAAQQATLVELFDRAQAPTPMGWTDADHEFAAWRDLPAPADCFMPAVACYDPAKPPSPELMDQIERAVLNSIERFFQQGSRWPGVAGAPVIITWSFVPDGTSIPSGVGEPVAPSNLFASMDAKFGGIVNRAVWIAQFQACFDRWAAITGTSYTRITFSGNPWDDGAAFGNGGAPGAAGLRGDVRICSKNIDGASGILAYNYYPAFGGDMVLDSSENWQNATNSYRFLRNVLTHEHGHGLGMLHVCPANATKLMEPFISTAYDGPQHDDIRGVSNLYGDGLEANNTAASATNLGALAPGGSFSPSAMPAPAVSNASNTAIDINGDSDYYRCSQAAANNISVTCAPVGTSYDSSPQCGSGNIIDSTMMAPLSVQLIASDGVTVLGTNNAALGGTAQLTNVPVGAGNFFVRVFESGNPTQPQMYNLTISAGATPAPNNDACANATFIGLGTVNGTNTGATQDGSTTCGFQATRDVWYTYTAACTGTLLIDTCGSAVDTVVSVHSACVGTTGNQLVCNDDNGGQGPCPGGLNSYLTLPVTGGTTYKIRVAGYNNTQGNFTLRLAFTGPANDNCAAATAVAENSVTNGYTCGANNDGTASCGASASAPDVWHTFTPSCSGTVRITTCGSNYDTVLSVHTGACGSLTQVACNDDAGSVICPGAGLNSVLDVNVQQGVTYRIRVSGFAGGTGNYTLNVGPIQAPSNDACANAPLVTNGTYTGSTCRATFNAADGTGTCGASSTNRDVWYRWTAPCTGNLLLNTCGSNYDTVVSVHTGTCGGLTQIGCNDDAGSGGRCPFTLMSFLSVPVTSGVTYYIRVSGFSAGSGSFVLTIDQQLNDRCEFAQTAVTGSNPFSTICATNDYAGECGLSTTSRDVWFAYTPPCNGTVTMESCTRSYDTVLSVYTGVCGGLSLVICNDDAGSQQPCPFTLGSVLSFNASGGTTYLVRASGFNNQSGTGTLNISVACGCDPDLNQDGNVDQDDITYLINVVAGGPNPTGINPDFNNDGNVDQDDITALINVVAGGPCP
jgi:hypothetical protein